MDGSYTQKAGYSDFLWGLKIHTNPRPSSIISPGVWGRELGAAFGVC